MTTLAGMTAGQHYRDGDGVLLEVMTVHDRYAMLLEIEPRHTPSEGGARTYLADEVGELTLEGAE